MDRNNPFSDGPLENFPPFKFITGLWWTADSPRVYPAFARWRLGVGVCLFFYFCFGKLWGRNYLLGSFNSDSSCEKSMLTEDKDERHSPQLGLAPADPCYPQYRRRRVQRWIDGWIFIILLSYTRLSTFHDCRFIYLFIYFHGGIRLSQCFIRSWHFGISVQLPPAHLLYAAELWKPTIVTQLQARNKEGVGGSTIVIFPQLFLHVQLLDLAILSESLCLHSIDMHRFSMSYV